jgi:hypothetical protein
MNITTINQLMSVTILLDRDEAIAALKDASALQSKLREALGDVAPIAVARKNGRRPKGRTAKARGTARASKAKKYPCELCGRWFIRRGNLTKHFAKMHWENAAAVDD